MKIDLKKTVYLFFIIMSFYGFSIANASWAETEVTILKDAKALEKIEKDYFNKRLKNDLKGVYQHQHPNFKKAISIEEFLYFEGRVVSGYRNGAMGHISGGMIPTMSWIKKNFTKKDALGFPRKSYYKWFYNPFIQVKDYNLEKISISKDGKYAMVKIILKGRERINPALVRENISFDFTRSHIDFWEKVEGKWVITVLADSSSVSGGQRTMYFIPNNNDAWGKKEYIHVDTEDLLAMPDADRHAVK
ncbi:MAG: hypothetical protein CMH75_04310 [Nitrospina sp.]|nr:hypothetical protein [Nitrospina sp.]|tara:strand:- start:779 stop:1519 length:741 start_codon:yes stop_codon:yes gene_type:complete